VRLIEKQVDFHYWIKSNAAFEVERILSSDYTLRDRLICFKTGDKTNHCYGCASSKSAKVNNVWLFSARPTSSSTVCAVDLYGRRWRIEEAFNTAKRLLGLSYLWTGSINGVKLKFGQLGCSTRLIDLADAVADELANAI